MQRYFLYVSYIGTQFRGAQKIINYSNPQTCDLTIQGCLETAVEKKLKPINTPHVITSSRTDRGVHALQSTFHVDLLKKNLLPYDTNSITTLLNKYFQKNNLQIRVLKVQHVSNNIHCRKHAVSRSYLYRLAILKKKYFNENVYNHFIPIEEYNRCLFICNPNFNLDNMVNALKLFDGFHDFRTFMGRGSHALDKITRRTLDINITQSMTSACLEQSKTDIYDYYNISFKSTGFLYNQVRRIVGVIVAVGQGKITNKDIICMLQIPSHLSWNPRVVVAPSYGLYLQKVDYSVDELTNQ